MLYFFLLDAGFLFGRCKFLSTDIKVDWWCAHGTRKRCDNHVGGKQNRSIGQKVKYRVTAYQIHPTPLTMPRTGSDQTSNSALSYQTNLSIIEISVNCNSFYLGFTDFCVYQREFLWLHIITSHANGKKSLLLNVL